jgi:argininosuccinate lyase
MKCGPAASQPLDPEFEKWQRSFPYDRRLLPFELEASGAHARALERAGVLPPAELTSILGGLEAIGQKATSSPEFLDDPEAEDVHHFVEKQLAELIGPTGYKLHTGRSRNEQIATDLRLFVRASVGTLQELLANWIDAFLTRAENGGGAAMPAYTHLQPAEPVLLAHWLLAYVEMFGRDRSRLADCRARLNSPSGSAPGLRSPIVAWLRSWGLMDRPPTAWRRPATAISPSNSSMRSRSYRSI